MSSRRRFSEFAAVAFCLVVLGAALLSGRAHAATGDISTIAGNGESDFSGDGGPATDAGISYL